MSSPPPDENDDSNAAAANAVPPTGADDANRVNTFLDKVNKLTVADIALYGYTHLADRCDFDLSTFPAIRDWLKRVEAAPGFVSMDWRPADVDDPASLAANA